MNEMNTEVTKMLQENKALLKENNKLLHKLYRNARVSFWFQVAWYLLLVGLPFALYFYVLDPYFTALGLSYETFNAGIQEIPGWKLFHEFMDTLHLQNPE